MKARNLMSLFIIFLNQEGKAGTATSVLGVGANVAASCTISTVNAIAFGAYVPTATLNMTATGSIAVRCTSQTAYHVRLDKGLGGSSTTARAMVGSGGTLPYNLYRDSGYSQNWGDVDGTDSLADTGTGNIKTHLVYATLPAGANVGAGVYADTVTVTVAY